MGGKMKTYKEHLIDAMTMLSKNKKTIFVGQSMLYKGHALYNTVKHIPENKRLEMPVCEELQTGICTGMAMNGFIPISIYPRMDFLICAINQIVNHLDKIEEMSDGEFKPKVIIRTAIGSSNPLMPGCQHNQDHTKALLELCTNINIVKLYEKEQIVDEYKKALESDKSTILIEIPDLYEK